MLHFVSSSAMPLHYISSGQLTSTEKFLHPKRIVDTFVLILGNRGLLHIEQNGVSHSIGENQYALLFPGMQHFGSQPSYGQLSYYWCHFKVHNNDYTLLEAEDANKALGAGQAHNTRVNNQYIIPEIGKLLEGERPVALFKQLLDAGKRNSHSEYLANYALSLLVMEISTDFVSGYNVGAVTPTYKRIHNIMEWVRVNYADDLSVPKIARIFNYNPNYLANTFKKYAGCSLVEYITRMKVNAAKKQLISTDDPVKVIALSSGFKDEKYFMRVFKKYEGVTPSQYRLAGKRV